LIDRDFRRAVIPLALFFGTFAWSFVYVSLATSVLARTSPAILYVAVAALGLGCVPLVGRGWAAGQEAMT
jgi:hypothetical protein